MNRRDFLSSGVAGTGALAMLELSPVASADLVKSRRDPFSRLKVGITSYSLRKFSLDEAIAMTKEAGVKFISLKDVHLPLKSTPAQRHQARQKIEAAGLTLLGGGVIYLKNSSEEIRQAFEYARDTGMPTMICSPEISALDEVEARAKEFDVRVAIHNHGPGDKRYPSPLDVYRLVRKRDRRMGLCMDVGHTVRIGQDPVEAIGHCADRLYDFHMKDVTKAAPQGSSVAVGEGVIDIVGVLKSLLAIKYPYHVALEYEAHADAPMLGIHESFAYMKGVLAAIG